MQIVRALSRLEAIYLALLQDRLLPILLRDAFFCFLVIGMFEILTISKKNANLKKWVR